MSSYAASRSRRFLERTICPRCGRRLHYRYDGLFRWKACPAPKACGWTVFNHGDDPRDGKETA